MDFLCLDFMNSKIENEAVRGDLLMNEAWLKHLCHKWGLGEQKKDTRTTLVQLRDALYQTTADYSKTGEISAENLSSLNAHLKPVVFHNRIENSDAGCRVREVPQSSKSISFPYQIIMSFADLVSNHEAGRIKICENPDCGWIFFDESKSRTRRWCGNTCASLIKVRRFRKRQLES